MMQKKDLAKEFSLIVQQEIKNHNDSILATNISLEDLKRQLEGFKEKSGKDLAAMSSSLTLHKSAISQIEERARGVLSGVLRQLNDLAASQEKQTSGILKSIKDRESYFLTIDGFKQFQSKVDEWIAHLKLSFSLQRDRLAEEVETVSRKLQASLDALDNSLSKKITGEVKEREKINKTLDYFSINFSGFIREIEICKKRCFIIEKNIENLYTQIERIKEGK